MSAFDDYDSHSHDDRAHVSNRISSYVNTAMIESYSNSDVELVCVGTIVLHSQDKQRYAHVYRWKSTRQTCHCFMGIDQVTSVVVCP
jgi:hypothetical protein